jgi:hypothetical protein
MSHVRVTVEPSFIGPDGVCIIDGVDVGGNLIKPQVIHLMSDVSRNVTDVSSFFHKHNLLACMQL